VGSIENFLYDINLGLILVQINIVNRVTILTIESAYTLYNIIEYPYINEFHGVLF